MGCKNTKLATINEVVIESITAIIGCILLIITDNHDLGLSLLVGSVSFGARMILGKGLSTETESALKTITGSLGGKTYKLNMSKLLKKTAFKKGYKEGLKKSELPMPTSIINISDEQDDVGRKI